MHSPVMKAVVELDPARALRAPGSPNDPELAAILRTERRVPLRTRAGRPVLVSAALAVATGIALVVTSPWSTPTAFATWTRVPSQVSSVVPVGLATECEPMTRWPDDTGQLSVEVPVQPVLTEVRGDYTYVVQAGEGVWSECLATVGTTAGTWDVVQNASLTPEPLDTVLPAADGLLTLHHGTTSWTSGNAGAGALTSAFGRAGADVVAVEVALDDGTTARASVSDGWWAVWAPGELSLTGEATATLQDGSTRTATIETP
ncbi:hypothetical protein [Antribacter gilvus]|uniref:hypothetical protein n=1 Tax=Antribacter gilvus TaxID=2304675 RepID=UPI000F78F81C|nr:hypothetical protein [Antribacter gilvus]